MNNMNSKNFICSIFRSSRPEVFCKKGVLRNFTKFTGKHLCQSLFFNKVADVRLLLVKFVSLTFQETRNVLSLEADYE